MYVPTPTWSLWLVWAVLYLLKFGSSLCALANAADFHSCLSLGGSRISLAHAAV